MHSLLAYSILILSFFCLLVLLLHNLWKWECVFKICRNIRLVFTIAHIVDKTNIENILVLSFTVVFLLMNFFLHTTNVVLFDIRRYLFSVRNWYILSTSLFLSIQRMRVSRFVNSASKSVFLWWTLHWFNDTLFRISLLYNIHFEERYFNRCINFMMKNPCSSIIMLWSFINRWKGRRSVFHLWWT